MVTGDGPPLDRVVGEGRGHSDGALRTEREQAGNPCRETVPKQRTARAVRRHNFLCSRNCRKVVWPEQSEPGKEWHKMG